MFQNLQQTLTLITGPNMIYAKSQNYKARALQLGKKQTNSEPNMKGSCQANKLGPEQTNGAFPGNGTKKGQR